MQLSRVKRISILILLLSSLSCASAPTVNQKQVTSIQVLQRLDEFQNLVITLHTDKAITTEKALLYSKFVLSSTRAIKELPNGWAPVVKASWVDLRGLINEPKLAVLVAVLDGLLK